MAGPPLKLTYDRQNRKLVAFNGTPTSLPPLFQSNTVSLQIQIVDPGPSSFPQVTSNAYTVVPVTGYGLRVAVGDTPAGTAGQVPLALQDTFTPDTVNNWFTGDLALNTAAIDSFLGTLAIKPAYFEVNLTINGTRTTISQETFSLKAVVDELTGTVPNPNNVYLTAAEISSQYVPQKGASGQTFILVSPDGLKSMELGVDNNGNLTTRIF